MKSSSKILRNNSIKTKRKKNKILKKSVKGGSERIKELASNQTVAQVAEPGAERLLANASNASNATLPSSVNHIPYRTPVSVEDRKKFFIFFGPTGAGKSTIREQLCRRYDIDVNDPTQFYISSIDDRVEIDKYYKQRVGEILRDLCGKFPNSGEVSICSDSKIIQQYLDNDDAFCTRKRFSDAYMTTRKTIGCGKTLDNDALSCDAINDERLRNAIDETKNIAFEAVGDGKLNWVFGWLFNSGTEFGDMWSSSNVEKDKYRKQVLKKLMI